MALKAYPFGEWTPDLASSNSNHLTIARNVRAIANGYAPIKDFQQLAPAMVNGFRGAASFIASDGTTSLIAGDPVNLYRYAAGAWTTLLGTPRTSGRWRFDQFGDNAICADGGRLVSYNLVAGTAAEIASSPANSIDVARLRDFVVALRDDDTVQWSEFNNSSAWGTGLNQADEQPLLGGGRGVAIVGGEYGIVLQKNTIQRMTYTGNPEVIFQFDVISPEVGCMAQGSVANVGRLVFFLSERGFMMCDGQDVTPIADEKFNRWFFSQYSREDIENIWSAVDPRNSLVWWAMAGDPGRMIAYNWVLKRATYVDIPVAGVFTGFTANVSLDAVDAAHPGGVDLVPVSLDDITFQGGNPLLLVSNAANELGVMSGDNLAATVRMPNVEPTQARRSRVRSIRPITDATTATATLDARMRAGDAEGVRTVSAMRLNGKMPVRANGRFVDVEVAIPAGERWDYLQGVEIEFEAGDNR